MFYKKVSAKVSLVLLSIFSFSSVSPICWRLEVSNAVAKFSLKNPDLRAKSAKQDFFNCVAESLSEIRRHGNELRSLDYNLNVVVKPVTELLKRMKKIDSFEGRVLLEGELSVFGENCNKSIEVFVPKFTELFFSMVLVNLVTSVSRDFSKNTQSLRCEYHSLAADLAFDISKCFVLDGQALSALQVASAVRLKSVAGLSSFALAVHDAVNDICIASEKAARK